MRSTEEAKAHDRLTHVGGDLEQLVFTAIPELPSHDLPQAKAKAVEIRSQLARYFVELIRGAEEEAVFVDSVSGKFFRRWDERFDHEGRGLPIAEPPHLPEQVAHVSTRRITNTELEGFCCAGEYGIDLNEYLHHASLLSERLVHETNNPLEGGVYDACGGCRFLNLSALWQLIDQRLLKTALEDAINASPQ